MRRPGKRKPLPAWATTDRDWRVAIRGMKLFVYWRNDMTPTYTFVKRTDMGNWIGHGTYGQSVPQIIEWCRLQPRPGQ